MCPGQPRAKHASEDQVAESWCVSANGKIGHYFVLSIYAVGCYA